MYFVRARGTDLVKIGYTGGEPSARLADLQTGCPYELVLEHVRPGSERLEHELHAEHAAKRVRGEWFRIAPVTIEIPPWCRRLACPRCDAIGAAMELDHCPRLGGDWYVVWTDPADGGRWVDWPGDIRSATGCGYDGDSRAGIKADCAADSWAQDIIAKVLGPQAGGFR